MFTICPYLQIYRTSIMPSQANPAVTAVAYVKGGPLAPDIQGIVLFRSVPGGTEVCAEISGLPQYRPAKDGEKPVGPHGFHIHGSGNCEVGNQQEPFKAAGEHWNPSNQPHGNHINWGS